MSILMLDRLKQTSASAAFKTCIISICLVACACYLAQAANIDMFRRVESCFSECAREMLQYHNYVAPTMDGKGFFDKPILAYWLIVLSFKMVGVSVFAARLPSIFSAVLCIALVSYIARGIYGDFVGILSGAILSTCNGFSDMAATAMSDMPLCLFELISIAAFFLGFKYSNKRTILFCLASASISAGFLTKGLPALVIPITAFVLFLSFYKKINVIRPIHLLLGISIFTVIVLPWHVALYKQCGMSALTWMYFHEQVQRFSADIVEYNFGHPFYYMAWSMVSQLMPWSLFLPIVIWGLIKDLRQNYQTNETQCSVMMLIFVLIHLVLFSLSKSNWGYYNLPAIPAASILIARYLSDYFSQKSGSWKTYRVIIPAFIFAGTCIFSLMSSLFLLPEKIKHEAQHSFANLIIDKCPKAKVIIHKDLVSQYFLCDWIQFKTGQSPAYDEQNEIGDALSEHRAVCVILPLKRFNQLPKSLIDRLSILSTEKFKFIAYPSCRLIADDNTDRRVTLALVTNQRFSDNCIADNYENYEKSILSEQNLANHKNSNNTKSTELPALDNKPKMLDGLASWWLAKAYFAQPAPPDVAILGSSQLGPLQGADAYVYNRRIDLTGDHRSYTIEHDLQTLLNTHWRVFVGALPGAMISDQLVISRALFSHQYKPKLVAITFSPRDFIDNSFPSSTATEAFTFFAKYANSQNPALLHDSLNKIRGENHDFTSVYDGRYDNISPILLTAPFKRIYPSQIVIGSGDGYFFADNNEEYRQRYKNPIGAQLTLQLNCLEALFKYLRQQHIAAVAVELPLTNANHILLPESFWKFYHKRIAEICQKNEVDYWNTESIWGCSISEFCDSVHLNLLGGLRQTRSIVLATAYKLHLPMYAYNGNAGPLVPGKEKIYFHKNWTGISNTESIIVK